MRKIKESIFQSWDFDPDAVIIRNAKLKDLPDLEWDGEFRHYRRVFQETYQRQQNGLGLMWIAILPFSRLAGQVFIQLTCNRPELANGINRAYLYAFRIKETYRNQGLGTRMMQFIERDLFERRYQFLTLNVAKDNIKALQLYERLGFVIKGHEEGRWSYRDHNNKLRHVHEPSWRMEKDLSTQGNYSR